MIVVVFILVYVSGYFDCLCICVPHVVPPECRRKEQDSLGLKTQPVVFTSVSLAVGFSDTNPLTCPTFHQGGVTYRDPPSFPQSWDFHIGDFSVICFLHPLEYKG